MTKILKSGLMACLATAFIFIGCKKDDDNKYTVTLSANNAEWGVVAGGGEYKEGAEIQIMATANSGYHFEKWSDDDTNNPRTITVNKNIALIAVFVEGNSGGSVNGGGNNNQGNTGTATGDILPKKVTKIVRTKEKSGENKSIRTYLFDSEGRATLVYDEGEWTLTYTDNQIIANGEKPYYNLENGRITSELDVWGGKGAVTGEFGYSPDGYLVSIKSVNGWTYEHKYTIENGSLTKSFYGEGKTTVDNWEREWVEESETTFTYGDKLNNLNVDVFAVAFLERPVYSNLIGKRQKYLPESAIDVNDGKQRNYTFSYEYSDEYLTKIEWGEGLTYEIFYDANGDNKLGEYDEMCEYADKTESCDISQVQICSDEETEEVYYIWKDKKYTDVNKLIETLCPSAKSNDNIVITKQLSIQSKKLIDNIRSNALQMCNEE